MAAAPQRKAHPHLCNAPPRPSLGESYRRSMSDEELRLASHRIYEKFTEEEKATLQQFVRERLMKASEDSGCADWRQTLKDHTNAAIHRRMAAGQPTDPEYIIDEVVPFALSTVSDEVRRDLFVKVSEMLR